MWRIKTFTGTVIEVQRFIDRPMHWYERPVCNERRELWLATSHDDEYKWVIHSKLMPARKDHRVTLLLVRGSVVGLYNATTGTSANYVREDPPFLTRGTDVLWMLALLVAGSAGAAMGWNSVQQVLGVALAYPLLSTLCRAVYRKRLQSVIGYTLNELQIMRVVRPMRRAQGH